MRKISAKKYIAVLITICLIGTGIPSPSSGYSLLAPPSVNEMSAMFDDTAIVEKHDGYAVVKKNGADHIICSGRHFSTETEDAARKLGRDRDVIIHEKPNFYKTPNIVFIYSIIIYIWLLIKRRFIPDKIQIEHPESMLQTGENILNIDVFYQRSASVCSFILILGLSAFFNAILFIHDMIKNYGFASVFYHQIMFIGLFTITMLYFFLISPGFKIDTNFRNLIFATKLAFLKDLLKKDDLKTLTMIGLAHTAETTALLASDAKRSKTWEKYIRNPLLRWAVKRKLDIVKSMEITKITQYEYGEPERKTIGTIAQLPGPSALIEKIYGMPVAEVLKSY